MQIVATLLFPVVVLSLLYLRYRMTRSRPSDYEAIDKFLKNRGLKKIAVAKHNKYWRYWIRGKLTLSNCARLYVVEADEPSGLRREIHVAFDQWPPGTGELQVLMEGE